VLLDANALLLPAQSRFPLESEVERLRAGATLAVPSSVIGELERLVARRVAGARLAVALARKFSQLPVTGRGDDAVLEAALRYHAWVVTADHELAERLRLAGVNVLVPRDRHRLELHRARAVPLRPTRPASRK
jgi:rRNA-processing protein FCF1